MTTKGKYVNTFAYEFTIGVHPAHFLANFVIHRFVFLKVVESEMLCQSGKLVIGEFFVEKIGYFLYFSSEILKNINNYGIYKI